MNENRIRPVAISRAKVDGKKLALLETVLDNCTVDRHVPIIPCNRTLQFCRTYLRHIAQFLRKQLTIPSYWTQLPLIKLFPTISTQGQPRSRG